MVNELLRFLTKNNNKAYSFDNSSQILYNPQPYMSEFLEPGPGYAIIGRWVYPRQDDANINHILQSDTYELAPGEGLLFVGDGDNPDTPVRFQQSELENILRETDPRKVQIMAIVEQRSGGLLFTDMTQENSIGIGQQTPQKVMTAKYGRITFAGIWGESQEEARGRLAQLQEKRLRRN